MSDTIRVGILGGGWPGLMHARGYQEAGGYQLLAVADLIPARRQKLMAEAQLQREYAQAQELIDDPGIDAISICLPNDLHMDMALAALRAGKHVLCETPPALGAAQAARMAKAAQKAGKVLLYGFQRRFGPHAQAAYQALAKGFVGTAYHARSAWTRTRAIPQGTGWFSQKEKSGGGALMDLGMHMLDLAWYLLGQPRPLSVYAAIQRRLGGAASEVEDFGSALLRFEEDKSLELSASWALNQPPGQNGAVCRVHGTEGSVDVYTPEGAVLYRHFTSDTDCKRHPLKPPKLVNHAALMRHFRQCILGKCPPLIGPEQGATLMRMMDGIYRSAHSGKSVTL